MSSMSFSGLINRVRLINRSSLVKLNMGMGVLLLIVALILVLQHNMLDLDWPAIAIYGLFYSAMLLLAYRLYSGIYAGFSQIVVTAAYLSVGSASMTIAVIGGALLAELGRILLHKPLNAPRNTLKSAIILALFNAASAIVSVTLAGEIYSALGGAMPLIAVHTRNTASLAAFYLTVFVLRTAIFTNVLVLAQRTVDRQRIGRLIRQLVISELLPLPMSFLLSVIFHSLTLITFFTVVSAVILIAMLYRFSQISRATLAQRVAELDLINAFGRSLAADLPVDELLEGLHHLVTRLVKNEMFVVALYNSGQQLISFPYISHEGKRLTWTPRTLNKGLSGYIINARHALLLKGDVLAQAAQLGITDIQAPIPLCYLGIPLIAYNQVIGTLSVESFTDPNAYGTNDINLLETLAPQAAVSLRNTDLYGRVAGITREITQLSDVSAEFNQTLDLDEVLRKVSQALIKISGAERSAIFLANDDNHTINLVYGSGLSADYMAQFRHLAIDEHPGFERIMRSPRVITISDVQTDERMMGWRWLAEIEGFRGLATTRLHVHEQPIGFLAVYYEQVHIFQPTEIGLLSTFSNQVSVAIANARLLHETQQRAEDVSQLVTAARMLTASLDLAQIGAKLSTYLAETLNLDLAMVLLWKREYAGLQPLDIFSNVISNQASEAAAPILLESPLLKKLAEGQQTLQLPHTTDDLYVLEALGVQTVLAIPLMLHSETAGIALLSRNDPGVLSDREHQFVDALLSHAATMLDNARLFSLIDHELDARVNQLVMIEHILRNISTLVDLPTVIAEVVTAALTMTGADLASCGLETLPGHVAFTGRLQGALHTAEAVPLNRGIVGQVMSSGQIVLLPDVRKNPHYVPTFANMLSELCVPIMSGGKTIGVLNMESSRLDAFTTSHVSFATTLAEHAAIAIDKARLFQDLRSTNEKMQAILNSTRDGMILIDDDGRLVQANPAAEKLLNRRLRGAVGKNVITWLVRETRRSGEKFTEYSLKELKAMTRMLKRDPQQITCRIYQTRTDDNTLHDIEEIGLPVYDKGGSTTARLFVLRDISEEKSLERFRDQVTDMIVHDLRSPLASMVTSLSMINDFIEYGELDNVKTIANIANANAHHLIQVVESILEIRRMENGLMALHQAPIKLQSSVINAMQALDATALDAQISLVNCLPASLPTLNLDEDKVRRVFINLLDNAIKHTPAHGEIRIESVLATDVRYIEIRVVDTGKGIPLEFREQVFGTFITLQGSALRGSRGVGLGLTFCRLTIEAHGGHIWVESGTEGGAAICLTLPIAIENVLTSEAITS